MHMQTPVVVVVVVVVVNDIVTGDEIQRVTTTWSN
jgi:hypothetical protein